MCVYLFAGSEDSGCLRQYPRAAADAPNGRTLARLLPLLSFPFPFHSSFPFSLLSLLSLSFFFFFFRRRTRSAHGGTGVLRQPVALVLDLENNTIFVADAAGSIVMVDME